MKKFYVIVGLFIFSNISMASEKPLMGYRLVAGQLEQYLLLIDSNSKAGTKQLAAAADIYAHFKCKKLGKEGNRILLSYYSSDFKSYVMNFKCDEVDKEALQAQYGLISYLCKKFKNFKDIDLLCRDLIVQ
jgi:hypothetical protein